MVEIIPSNLIPGQELTPTAVARFFIFTTIQKNENLGFFCYQRRNDFGVFEI